MCGATRHVRFGPKADIGRYSITSSAAFHQLHTDRAGAPPTGVKTLCCTTLARFVCCAVSPPLAEPRMQARAREDLGCHAYACAPMCAIDPVSGAHAPPE